MKVLEQNHTHQNIQVYDKWGNLVRNGNVIINVNGHSYKKELVGGKCIMDYDFDLSSLNNITVSFEGIAYSSSVQTTQFSKSDIITNITFDINLGAGTNNGGGEENKFLLDCYKAKLQIYFVPHKIASHYKQVSTWFFGYDANYFYNRGKSTRYIFGFWFACLYGVYFLLAKYSVYKGTIPLWTAAKNLFYGISRNELKIYD